VPIPLQHLLGSRTGAIVSCWRCHWKCQISLSPSANGANSDKKSAAYIKGNEVQIALDAAKSNAPPSMIGQLLKLRTGYTLSESSLKNLRLQAEKKAHGNCSMNDNYMNKRISFLPISRKHRTSVSAPSLMSLIHPCSPFTSKGQTTPAGTFVQVHSSLPGLQPKKEYLMMMHCMT
jgi:hypothetical protein